MSWNPYTGDAKGVLVEGDPSVPATKWYNHWWLYLFGWKQVAVFEAKLPNPVDPFFVGFIAFDGTKKLCDEKQRQPLFRMLVGREDCTFFAVGSDGQEIPLRLIRKMGRGDPAYAGSPLV